MQDHVITIKIVKTKNTDKCMILIGFIISVVVRLLVYLEALYNEFYIMRLWHFLVH